jgi:hypothetical protein
VCDASVVEDGYQVCTASHEEQLPLTYTIELVTYDYAQDGTPIENVVGTQPYTIPDCG